MKNNRKKGSGKFLKATKMVKQDISRRTLSQKRKNQPKRPIIHHREELKNSSL
jgi:hypothetical protein